MRLLRSNGHREAAFSVHSPAAARGMQRPRPPRAAGGAHAKDAPRAAAAAPQPAAPAPAGPRTISGLREVADEFDGVLLDQFGVLHDGSTPYAAAIDAVRELAAAGKAVVVVSNSSRRASGTIGALVKKGFQAEWFAGAVTSGELTHTHLAERPDAFWRGLGSRCIHITWSSRGAISLEGLGLTLVDSPADQPDFILAHGTEAVAAPSAPGGGGGAARDASLEQLRALLANCAAAAAAPGGRCPWLWPTQTW